MNFSEIWDEAVSIELGTSDTIQLFTVARRKKAVNDANLKFCSMTKCSERYEPIVMVDGVGEYDLYRGFDHPDQDFFELSGDPSIKIVASNGAVRWIEGDNLPQSAPPLLNHQSPGWRSQTGSTPQAWYHRVGPVSADGLGAEPYGVTWIGVTPAPTITAGDTWTLYVPYIAKPYVMGPGDEIGAFTVGGVQMGNMLQYHQALAHYAAAQLEKNRKGYVAAQNQLKEFAGYVAQYLQDRHFQQPAQISLARNYFGESRRGARPDDWRR